MAEILGERVQRGSPSPGRSPTELIVCTGLRKGEALAVHWHDVLLRLRKEADRSMLDGFVFHHDDGTPLHLNHFRQLARAAGLPDCTVDDLRHFAVTTARALKGEERRRNRRRRTKGTSGRQPTQHQTVYGNAA